MSHDGFTVRTLERLKWFFRAPWPVGRETLLNTACVAFLLLLGALLFGLTIASKPLIVEYPDSEDMAQIARHLEDGEGWVTSFMPLNGLAYLRQANRVGEQWPAITRFPLMPLVLAIAFRLFGESDWTIALSSGIFWLGGIPLTYFLTKKLFGWYAGFAAALLYIAWPHLRSYATSGLTEPANAFFLLLMVAAIYRGNSRNGAILGGVALGMAFLNRNNSVLLMLPSMLYLYWIGGAKRVTQYAIGFAPFLLAGTLLNFLLSGDPTFNLQLPSVLPLRLYTGVLGWYSLDYVPVPSFVFRNLGFLAYKLASQLKVLVTDILPAMALSPYFFALVLLGFSRPYERDIHRLRLLVLSMFALHAVFIAAFAAGYDRMYIPFEPFAIIFGTGAVVASFETLAPRSAFVARIATVAVAVAVLAYFGVKIERLAAAHPSRPEFSGVEVNLSNLQYVQQRVGVDEIVASDLPWSVAWRANRRAIPLPPRPDMISEVEKRYDLSIGAIYIKVKGIQFPDQPPTWAQWRELGTGATQLSGYEVDKVFPDGSVLFVKQ